MPEAAPVTSAALPERSALIMGVSLQKGRQLSDRMPPPLRLSSRPRPCYPFAIRTREEEMASQLLSKLPSRLHHNAFVVRDHETNRRFFEDLLGIPLVATWCEKNYSTEMQKEIEFCHTFFGMADGSALAFFQFADPEMYEQTQAEKPPKIGRHYHIAFKAEPDTYEELKQRLERAGEKYRETNHGYCKSIYVNSPDGLIVEFTQDPEDVAEIDAVRRSDAHSELTRWLAGDRRTNNELRGRAF